MPKFNPKNPFNDLPLLPPNFNFNEVDILKTCNTANIALAELKGQNLVIPLIPQYSCIPCSSVSQ